MGNILLELVDKSVISNVNQNFPTGDVHPFTVFNSLVLALGNSGSKLGIWFIQTFGGKIKDFSALFKD